MRGLLVSFLIHLLILADFTKLAHPVQTPPDLSKTQYFHVQILPSGSNGQCSNWYNGIGVENKGQLITEVYPGYPAAQSGIQSGDTLISPDSELLRGKLGEVLTLTLLRNGQQFNRTVIRSKICHK